MQLIRLPGAPAPESRPPVIATIGNFDGVHRGHRALLDHVRVRAAKQALKVAVVTFDPHPRLVLRPSAPLRLISPVEEKLALFEEAGVDITVLWRFDATLQQMDAEEFLRELRRYVTLRHLVHGPGFALGRRRQGTPEVVAEIGKQMGFSMEVLSAVELEVAGSGSEPVTSTAIRSQIEAGQVVEAARGLGRPPTVSGTVVEGEKLGRTLGFPTANLDADERVAIPADGVYAASAELHPFTAAALQHPAAVSAGTRPTFDGRKRVVEAYLLDFDGDLYGQPLRLHFVRRLRGQERFDSIDAVIQQMVRDEQKLRAELAAGSGAPQAVGASPGSLDYR